MCLEWGLIPAAYDALPRAVRAEMVAFWRWRLERQEGQRQAAALNAKFFPTR